MVPINQLNTSFYGKPESCSQQLKEINQKLQDMKNQLAREQAQKKELEKELDSYQLAMPHLQKELQEKNDQLTREQIQKQEIEKKYEKSLSDITLNQFQLQEISKELQETKNQLSQEQLQKQKLQMVM
jgi:chromosome segregation ATPase